MPKVFSDRVTLGALVFNGDTKDEDGTTWYLDGLTGWEDSVEPLVEQAQDVYSDGAVVSDHFSVPPRFVEVQGVIVAKDRELAVKAFRKLQETLAPNKTVTARRYAPYNEQMSTRCVGRIDKPQDLGHAFRFQTTLMSPWPYKTSLFSKSGETGAFTGFSYVREYPRTYALTYDLVEGDGLGGGGSEISLANNGNATAFPTLSIRGPFSANTWSVVNQTTGDSISFSHEIHTGETLVINTLRRTARIGGVDMDYYIRGDWLTMPPGEVSVFRLTTGSTNPAANLTVSMADTWR